MHALDATPRAGHLSVEDLKTAVNSGDITTVLLAVPNMLGQLKGKRLDAPGFLETITKQTKAGAEMCAYILATNVDMEPLDGFELTGWETGFGDFRVVPDLATIRRLPYMPGTVLIHGDALHHSGLAIDAAPRAMLRTQIDRLTKLGLAVKVGLESEFMLYRGTAQQAHAAGYRALEPVAPHNLDYALDHPMELTDFLDDLENVLRGAGTRVEAVKTEGAAGQIEVTFPYGEAMAACDAYTVYKHAVKHLGGRHGMTPTFMASPRTELGSGLHLHLSLWRDGRNAFAVCDEGELPETVQEAIAGLLSGLPHLGPLYASNVNSYKRFRLRSFAPTHFTWGRDNRGCAIRVIGHGDGAHLEVRLAGADANPYLALAASLAAIHHGLTERPEFPPETTGDAYQTDDGLPVPADLGEALADFRSSKIALDAFGPAVVRHYAYAARHEIRWHRHCVTDAERERGFLRA
ncbi:glutamine synthetase family protein [Streptomyces phaeochromogenes]|uniref:Glutamine synthetase family protein n=1 Tax=Streptomyces phaeochromogenes TaxID=1923 RepID=A0ABZ1H0W3_STRPH|nr:glutamine synthetase family protein [Streptomyces phaeochromogenes]WSD11795.1 glutamine synthetase family protein [Streptomyces phaeochromogenes]